MMKKHEKTLPQGTLSRFAIHLVPQGTLSRFAIHLVIFSLIIFYLVLHLPSLTNLPVFADESIYIRWAQLIIDDWKRYLFFPMNDGKTPLFIWAMVPFQFLFKDQLFAGRFVSLLVGLVQIFLNMGIIKSLGGRKKTQIFAGAITSILPFWYFHHRMALMDGLLTLLISITLLFLIKISRKQKEVSPGGKNLIEQVFDKSSFRSLIVAGFSFGLAMLTKIPAILFIPSFYLLIFLNKNKNLHTLLVIFLKISLSILIGLLMFVSLKIHPVFGQLFSRGGDFLFPISEILGGKWKETIGNIPSYINYFLTYLTPGIIIFSIIGLFSKKHRKIVHILFWSGVIFILPIALMGKTVYPRYIFPASLFFTLSAVMGLESLIIEVFEKTTKSHPEGKLWKKVIVGVVVSLLIANTVTSSLSYIQLSMFDSNNTPFVSADSTQYLEEWSSGHGIKETVDLINHEAKTKTIAVATEGYFGTLPDGLLIYFHRMNVDNIYVEGVGQPVVVIPQSFADRAENFDRKWLVVNSHRMNLDVDKKYLVAEFCRPFDAPCLQVWDLTEGFESYIK